ncbi:DUF302 domain-containing protein [Thermoplasma sp.]|uniref:DUF302 domain-containing protein n=1 Tax=Thermoplasma sp. TaxID=1973142 RepID=UPI00126CEB46|nr:DUF302 domain-containing protein [Thermoplasma sp.]KAA8923389.1 MAG: DUF302 domain-containing protein [Thermoplasma sp.]
MYKFDMDVNGSLEEVYGRIFKVLKDAGYVMLSYVDVAEILARTMNKKIDPLYILNVCKPVAANEFINESYETSMFIPCKLVLHQTGDKTTVSLQLISPQIEAFTDLPTDVARKYENEIIEVLKKI